MARWFLGWKICDPALPGCAGNEAERNYYKELAMATPQESIILTLGCGKYRFNKMNVSPGAARTLRD